MVPMRVMLRMPLVAFLLLLAYGLIGIRIPGRILGVIGKSRVKVADSHGGTINFANRLSIRGEEAGSHGTGEESLAAAAAGAE